MLAEFLVDAGAYCHHLLDLVATDLVDLPFGKATHVHATLGHFRNQYIVDLPELELVVGKDCEQIAVANFDSGVGALEVKPVAHLAVRLINGISQLDLIDL